MNPKRISVASYAELARQGILTEDDHVELLDGLIVQKGPKTPPHDSTIDVMNALLLAKLPEGWFFRNQKSLVTDDSVPEPDLAVARGEPGRDYTQHHPTGRDVGLVIEVADSTVPGDRAKAAIYARAGIPHYWIINLDDGQIEVFSEPKGRGAKRAYQTSQVLRGEAVLKVVLAGSPVGSLAVREIMG